MPLKRKSADVTADDDALAVADIIGRVKEKSMVDELLATIESMGDTTDRTVTSTAVLIEGEAGVGKSVMMAYVRQKAQALHLPIMSCKSACCTMEQSEMKWS